MGEQWKRLELIPPQNTGIGNGSPSSRLMDERGYVSSSTSECYARSSPSRKKAKMNDGILKQGSCTCIEILLLSEKNACFGYMRLLVDLGQEAEGCSTDEVHEGEFSMGTIEV